MGKTINRREVLSAAPALALAGMGVPQLLPNIEHLPIVEDDSGLGFLQLLRTLSEDGRANFVAWLQSQDHPIFNALADPVERYCAQLNAADQFCGNSKG